MGYNGTSDRASLVSYVVYLAGGFNDVADQCKCSHYDFFFFFPSNGRSGLPYTILHITCEYKSLEHATLISFHHPAEYENVLRRFAQGLSDSVKKYASQGNRVSTG